MVLPPFFFVPAPNSEIKFIEFTLRRMAHTREREKQAQRRKKNIVFFLSLAFLPPPAYRQLLKERKKESEDQQ
jgi:hypothetical protein